MPHIMKRIFLFAVIALAAISLTSCLESKDQATPVIQAGYITRVSAAGVCDTISFADTLHVADTLRVPLALWGVYNNLTTFQVSADTSAVAYQLLNDSSYLHLLDNSSAPEKGYLRFVTGCVLFETTLQYIPKKTGDYEVKFVLASDAGEKYSPLDAYFVMRVH
jgi:hypothetical protein